MASTSVSSSISRGRGVIEQINPRLFAGQFNGKDSEPLYFGFEEVTSENKQFWRGYQKSAGALQDLLRRFSASVTESSYPAYPNELSEYFSYNEEQYYSVVKHIQKNRLFHAELEKIDSGLWEMADVCYPTGTTYSRLGKFYHNIKVFMVYLSKVPVTKVHTRDDAIDEQIVMSFVFITSDEVPTATHYGFLKNPASLLSVQKKFRENFMLVHGFAAAVALNHFKDKKWMVTRAPTDEMSLFSESLRGHEMHVGTNKEHHLSIMFRDTPTGKLLRRHAPIWHIDSETRIKKIAKEGFTRGLKSLPDEQAEYIAPAKQWINFAPPNRHREKTVIRFERLATYFSDGREEK